MLEIRTAMVVLVTAFAVIHRKDDDIMVDWDIPETVEEFQTQM